MTHRPPPSSSRAAYTLAMGVMLLLSTSHGAAAASVPDSPPDWNWPVSGAVVVAPFEAPAHRYGPGHRGIDLAPGTGVTTISAPADGVIAFAGPVGGRGVITIDHGGGWVTSVEPVSETLRAGVRVGAGDRIADIAAGGHAMTGTVHVGVRFQGEYVNPLSLIREVPRAVLLPCC